MSLRTAIAWYQGIQRHVLATVDRLVPARQRDNPIDMRRGRLLIGLLLVAAVPMPVFILTNLFAQRWFLVAICTAVLIVFSSLIAIYRVTGRHGAVTHIMLSLGLAGVVGSIVQTGGIYSLAAPFVLVLPVMAFALVGVRWGHVWFVTVTVTLVGFVGAELAGVELPAVTDGRGEPITVLFNHLTLLAYTYGVLVFLHGINVLRRKQLHTERLRAELASQAKSAFLANMSHELRTPMNGVLGLTEVMLAEGDLTPAQTETLRTVKDSGHALVRLLDDLLDLSKVEAGGMTVEAVPTDPERVVREVVQLLRERASRKGVRLLVEGEPDVGWGLGDPARLRQVLLNLIGNAVKFTSDAEVRVRLWREHDRLYVQVSDDGIGIDEDKLAHLFEPFVQADASTTRNFGGSGLGLAICKRLVALMGGDISVESERGVGSTFRFHVHLPPCEPVTPLSVVTTDLVVSPGLRILVAEDNAVNQLVTLRMLERLGATVDVVQDGQAALDALDDQPYDVIIMDLHMPGMDGLQATREARLRGSRVPIIALTASARPEDQQATMEAGMDAFLAKPVRMEDLRATLSRVTARAR